MSKGVQYATEEKQRTIANSSRKYAVTGPKWKGCSFLDVPGCENKVRYCEKQYFIQT